MANKEAHTEKEFNQLIRQKLENHQMPVGEELWQTIEKQMAITGKPKKRHLFPYYLLAGASAAVLALLILLTPFQEIAKTGNDTAQHSRNESLVSPVPSEVAAQPASYAATTDTTHNPQSTPVATNNATGISTPSQSIDLYATGNAKHKVTTEVSKVKIERSNSEKETPHKTSSDAIGTSTTTAATVQQTTKKISSEPQNENKVPQQNLAKIDRLPDLNDYPQITPHTDSKKKKNRRVTLAAAFRTGDRTTTDKNTSIPPRQSIKKPTRPLVSKEVTGNYVGILKASDYSKAIHNPPVSAGITVDIPLTNALSIETGVVYTYLKSDYEKTDHWNYNGTLQLHYLGVPVNFKIKVLNKENWNLYVSAGGMFEKGLQSIYTQKVNNNLYTRNTTVKSDIDGIQSSLNGAVGAEYKLSRHIGLFVEPKVIYYFENSHQPMSARSEQPLNVGICVGIRFGL